jgi:hypothetical protein
MFADTHRNRFVLGRFLQCIAERLHYSSDDHHSDQRIKYFSSIYKKNLMQIVKP